MENTSGVDMARSIYVESLLSEGYSADDIYRFNMYSNGAQNKLLSGSIIYKYQFSPSVILTAMLLSVSSLKNIDTAKIVGPVRNFYTGKEIAYIANT